ncbi:hypothetical protein ACVWXN_004640 [Bradyrhizobium sp. i1.4.4]
MTDGSRPQMFSQAAAYSSYWVRMRTSFEASAFLGGATSVNSDKAELIEIAKKRGIDLIELLEKAKAIQAANGFPNDPRR